MNKFLFAILLVFSSFVFGQEKQPSKCKRYFNNFNEEQIEVIRHSYNYAKENNLGYTVAAIAIQESIAGRVKVNIDDPSAGVHHIVVYKVVRALGKPVNQFTVNQVTQKLIDDRDLSARFALKELLFWKGVYGGNWEKSVASYNAGWQHENGEGYVDRVSSVVNKLMQCSDLFFIKGG